MTSVSDKIKSLQQTSENLNKIFDETSAKVKEYEQIILSLFINFEVKMPLSDSEGIKWSKEKGKFLYFKVINGEYKHSGTIGGAPIAARKRFIAKFDMILDLIREKYELAAHEVFAEDNEEE